MSENKKPDPATAAQPVMKEYRSSHVTVSDSYGMGHPEAKDLWPTQDEVEARIAADPDYTPNHDGRLWLIV